MRGIRFTALSIIIFGFFIPLLAHASVFSDVPSDYKYYKSISNLSDSGAINGYNDGSFHPDGLINRAELMKLITTSLLSDNEIDNCISDNSDPNWDYLFFTDVPISAWYSKYICAATTHGFVSGYADSTFQPSNHINFAEALKAIIESRGINVNRVRTVNSPMLYINDEDWFSGYFSYAYNKNLINKEKFYHPAQFITRGEAAEIVYRLDSIIKNNKSEYQTGAVINSDEYTITIPRLNIINLNVSFADPYDSQGALDVLKDGLGQYLSPPGEGKKMIIFGHSSGYSWDNSAYKTVLRQINKIEDGDKIYLNYHEKGYVYQVYKKEIMPATELSSIITDDGCEELAIYTCWPPDSIKQRYIVYATPQN